MRFIETGPDVPSELLLALDEDRVVFSVARLCLEPRQNFQTFSD